MSSTLAAPEPRLKPHQVAALRALAADPGAASKTATYIPPAALSKLRKLGLVGKVVPKRGCGQRTTSPLTEAGRAYLEGVGQGKAVAR